MDTQSPSSLALHLLLAQDKLRYLSGTDTPFRRDLSFYADTLLADLRRLRDPGIIDSRDSLEALLSPFFIGSLIQHLLGRQDRACVLIHCTIQFVHRVAEQACLP